ncbi:MAG: choice-of-anchor L domain-containing protein [Saprospiraceae bacterium]|nr:choice-of-anchor L domain-containing protein [Saprospiraceae bacterium]MCF8251830.1 choice-of-anchor L domain-containing protein [Saprospiraceae bacterium]MCF8281961.1 choice-of-anchor L domain-containing protein [Bacteroidales bacterium]MCF8313304.1 choice-of-anchor L domain-containing protein [Saprospiraceae bacterium]MCF8441740.1 choice-of-anchor L domain-containing protein [Saprospiraceae bacterium]
MKSKIYALFFTLFFFAGANAQSNLFIDTSYTAEQMVMDFFANSCATPSNVTYNGAPATMAFFEGANTNLGVNAGIVISTGDVTLIAADASTFVTGAMSGAGDSDLQNLNSGGFPSYDAAVLEFDLTVTDGGDMNFQYVFGSEEYPEWVGTSFNDVFGFLFNSPSNPNYTNIALIPGAGIPVSINNVNGGLNSQYYIANDTLGNADIVFDGMTTPLLASFMAVDNETYHIKIGVADISDAAFDSGVFIGIESLCGDSLLTPPAEAIATVTGNTVTFQNNSRYATVWHWDFGDGTTSDERYPAPHTYAQDGQYTVILTTQNWCCTDSYTIPVQVGASATNEATSRPFSIQPNPATDYVQLTLANLETVDYQLLDLAGRTVLYGTTTSGTKLDLRGLTPGAYLFLVKNERGVYTEKLMVK